MGRLIGLATDAERAFASNVPPSVWGPKAWALLHATVEDLPCPTCRDEGVIMMEACHDLVNVHKGEKPERPESLCILAQQTAGAALKTGSVCRLPAVLARKHRPTPDVVSCPEPDRARSRGARFD